MKINREEWVERLTKLCAATSTSTITPTNSCFLFSKGRIMTSNGTVTMTTSTSIIPETGKYVPAGPLMKLLTSIRDDEVELIFVENLLKVKTNRLKGKLVTVPEEKSDKKEAATEQMEISAYPDFIEAVKFCRLAASEDLTTQAMCGVHLDGRWTFGSDRYRIFTCLKDAYPNEVVKCTLPVQFIDIVDRYKEEVRRILFFTRGDKVDHVDVILEDSTVISSKVLEGDYADLTKFFPTDEDVNVSFPYSDEFVQVVNRQASFLSNIATVDRELLITIDKGKCVFKVVNRDYGTLDEEIDMPEVDMNLSITICINPTLITDALNDVTDDHREISFYPEKNLLRITGGSCKCIMPTIVEEEKPKETND